MAYRDRLCICAELLALSALRHNESATISDYFCSYNNGAQT